MFCSNCGSRLADGAKFCSECGARVVRTDEPIFRTNPDIDFEEPKVDIAPAEEPVVEKIPERPVREKVTFDWSNVVDEPHRREVKDIRSPWATTGGVDEKELYAEMTPSTDKSRTMSFIDVLRAEKEEKERAAADKAIEYTEVLEFDPDLMPFEEPPKVRFAPLYEDVEEAVTTPFDLPEDEKKLDAVFEDGSGYEKPQFEEPEFEEPKFEEPKFEEPQPEEPEINDEPNFSEPDESSLEVSRETIAQFDEYVKSFEKEAGIYSEPEFEEPKFEEPLSSFPKFELPDFLKKVTDKVSDFAKEFEAEPEEAEIGLDDSIVDEYDEYIDEPVVVAPLPEETEEELEPEFELKTPELFEDDVFADDDEDEEPVFGETLFGEPEIEETPFEEPTYEDVEIKEPEEESMEDLYLSIDPTVPTRDYTSSYPSMDLDDDDDDEEDEDAEIEVIEIKKENDVEKVTDEGIDEEELFREMDESKPEMPNMTIAPPADKESEIEALKKRLMELTGVHEINLDLPAEKPDGIVDVDIEEEAPEDVFEPEVTPDIDELFASLTPASYVAEPADPVFEPEVTPDIDELFAGLIPASKAAEAEEEIAIEDFYLQDPLEPEVIEVTEEPVAEEAAPVAEAVEEPAPEVVEVTEEPVVEEAAPVAEAVEEPAPEVAEAVEEPAPEVVEVIEEPAPAEKKATDALSLEELERDLFGDDLPEEVEAEETKKIDKFYTLYRKNEEFQRLLDEEYEKLKHGGGLTEEEKAAVDAVPKMADIEAAREASKAAPAAAAAAAVATAVTGKAQTKAAVEDKTEAAAPVTPVENNKAYRQIEDETIYMPKEEIEKQVKAEFAANRPEEVPEESKGKKGKKKVEVEYEDVESGNKLLTALAVIIAIILIILLAVILILQIAPDSGMAAWIDSIIESITSKFSLIDSFGGQYLL